LQQSNQINQPQQYTKIKSIAKYIVSSAVTVSVKINLPNGIGMVNPGNRISLIHPAVLICESYQRNPMFAKSLGKIEISAGDSLSWKVNLPTVFRLNIDLHVDVYGG
jgi:hypothetical protein